MQGCYKLLLPNFAAYFYFILNEGWELDKGRSRDKAILSISFEEFENKSKSFNQCYIVVIQFRPLRE